MVSLELCIGAFSWNKNGIKNRRGFWKTNSVIYRAVKGEDNVNKFKQGCYGWFGFTTGWGGNTI